MYFQHVACSFCPSTPSLADPLTGEIGLSGSEFAGVLSRACVDFPPEITKATIEVRHRFVSCGRHLRVCTCVKN